jgi:hypothetical protein
MPCSLCPVRQTRFSQEKRYTVLPVCRPLANHDCLQHLLLTLTRHSSEYLCGMALMISAFALLLARISSVMLDAMLCSIPDQTLLGELTLFRTVWPNSFCLSGIQRTQSWLTMLMSTLTYFCQIWLFI